MFPVLPIANVIPRETSAVEKRTLKGLLRFCVYGAFLGVSGLFVFTSAIVFQMETGPRVVAILLALLMFALSGSIGLFVAFRRKARRALLRHGQPVFAYVVEHGRSLHLLRYGRDFTIRLVIDLGGHRMHRILRWHTNAIWHAAPLQSQLVGLYHDGSLLFGEELGVTFQVENPAPAEHHFRP